MIATAIKVVCGLTRLDTCALVFISIFLPVYIHGHEFYYSFTHAVPVLTICMCGFVINDLSDIEKDRANHPNRPLPSKSITEVEASILYFSLLASSLILVKIYVDLPHVYLYVLLLVALINYNYVVCYVPVIKNLYVALVGLIPILILSSLINNIDSIHIVAASLFLFLLGREMLMDVEHATGEEKTLTKKLGIGLSENIAFGVQFSASILLCLLAKTTMDLLIVSGLLMVGMIFFYFWKARRHRRVIIHAMKLQLLAGIYYLI